MKYDILEILIHHDKSSRLLREIEDNKNTLAQHIAQAADEIERLRKENKELKKKIKNYENDA